MVYSLKDKQVKFLHRATSTYKSNKGFMKNISIKYSKANTSIFKYYLSLSFADSEMTPLYFARCFLPYIMLHQLAITIKALG